MRRVVILGTTAVFTLLGLLTTYAIGIYPALAAIGGDWRAVVDMWWFALPAVLLLILVPAYTISGWRIATRREPHHSRDTP